MVLRRIAAVAVCAITFLVLPATVPPAFGQDGIDGMRLLGRNEDEFAHVMDAHIVGDYAYMSVGSSGGLESYDISDPANPIRTSTMDIPTWRAWAGGDTIFGFCHGWGVRVGSFFSGKEFGREEHSRTGQRVGIVCRILSGMVQ